MVKNNAAAKAKPENLDRLLAEKRQIVIGPLSAASAG